MFITSCKDDLQLTGYQLRAVSRLASDFQDGILAKSGQECEVTYSGLDFMIGTGLVLIGGVVAQNTEPIPITLDTASVQGTKYLVITTDGGGGVTDAKFVSEIKDTTDLIENPQGKRAMPIYTVNHSGSGVTGLKDTRNIIDGEPKPTKVTIDLHESPKIAGDTFDLGYTPNQLLEAILIKGVIADNASGVDLKSTLIGANEASPSDLFLVGTYDSGTGQASSVCHLAHVSATTWRVAMIRRNYLQTNGAANEKNMLTKLVINF